MKKRLVALMLGAMLAVSAAGCGAEDENNAVGETEGTESVEGTETSEKVVAASSAFDLKGSDYVKLCDYNDISITITGDYEVEDTEVHDYFAQTFTDYGPFYMEDTEKQVIEEGDIVDVDYVGKLEGEAFEGGSAEHQLIDVYNNASATGSGYIEGFTDGLKGAKVGDVIDCDVTFPEDYGNADLAGKAVVFTFTVEQFQVETVEEMYEVIREALEQQADFMKQRDTYTTLQQYLMDNCTVEVPEDYVAARVSDYKNQYITYYCGGDESQLENYVSTYEGKTVEEMEAYWQENLTQAVRLELIMDAIAEEMDLTVSDEDFDAYAQMMAASGGYESPEAMYGLYGYGDAEYGSRYFRDLYLYDLALEKVAENAKVTVDTTLLESEEGTEAVEETELP